MAGEKDAEKAIRARLGSGEKIDLADRFNKGMKSLFGSEAPKPMKKKKRVKVRTEFGDRWEEVDE